MKIILDRRGCNCWDASCDAHFGWHFLREEIAPVECLVEAVDDGNQAITFCIKDRDGLDKVLVVDQANRAEVYDFWHEVLEKQQT